MISMKWRHRRKLLKGSLQRRGHRKWEEQEWRDRNLLDKLYKNCFKTFTPPTLRWRRQRIYSTFRVWSPPNISLASSGFEPTTFPSFLILFNVSSNIGIMNDMGKKEEFFKKLFAIWKPQFPLRCFFKVVGLALAVCLLTVKADVRMWAWKESRDIKPVDVLSDNGREQAKWPALQFGQETWSCARWRTRKCSLAFLSHRRAFQNSAVRRRERFLPALPLRWQFPFLFFLLAITPLNPNSQRQIAFQFAVSLFESKSRWEWQS